MRLNSIFERLPAGSSLADSKDRFISDRIKQELNVHLARYGEVKDVKLNTREQSLDLSLSLKGETDLISVHIGKYSLVKENEEQENEELWLAIDSQSLETSREWLTVLLQDQAARQRLPIPQKYARLIEFLA